MKSKLTILLNENQYRQIFNENQTESLESYQQKLKQMIESGDEDNIRLAFSYESAIQTDYPQFDMESFILSVYGDLLYMFSLNADYGISNYDGVIDELITLFNIEGLDLSEQALYGLPENIGILTNLTWLNLYSAKLETLPKSFKNLKNLTYLNFDDNNFKQIPNEIVSLSKLESLTFGDILEIPQWIGNLSNLKILDLHSSEYDNFPESFAKLTALENLDVSGTYIKTIPNYFTKFQNLKVLDISVTEISENELAKIRQMLPNTEIIFE